MWLLGDQFHKFLFPLDNNPPQKPWGHCSLRCPHNRHKYNQSNNLRAVPETK